ncbi:hypothetical protein LTR10_022505 [Elasticomyces elasticus]|uniref:DUF221-domain-containing protein n=1 Tax=Exophiala sideris TaxID=1016849 RepID=A0ABR0J921_9EURO|nr:hypothetical protein LTR10_022505 [Elasticomyces elasticus]KAK5029454.1 hypothetical protein LTS07_005916 [Exophiala sideris]KAK5058084.1 hypothetical protein LTR69_007081 [Exophiala sideris]KAK5182043.1 hypothetical protein LTR44_005644 [Eurotiomycetes sp. CCFEE 6388]
MERANDPRVGSGRDNSSSTTVTSIGSSNNSSSLSSLYATLLPVLVYTAICIIIFIILRRKSPRVYAPRSILTSLDPHERSPKLPTGWFNWILPFSRIPDTYVLNHSSLDGYLFLRFLKILVVICFVGLCITWPILLPIHATGGGGLTQLDKLAFGNVFYLSRFWAHAIVLWIYFGFVLYMVSRECIYYVHLRQAYLHSPFYAKRLSSRTVMFTSIPKEYRDEAKLKKIFGDVVKTVWLPKSSKELANCVEERRQTALRLEKAEIALIKMANAARTKAMKNGDFAIKERPHPNAKKGSADSSASEVTGKSVMDSPSSTQKHSKENYPSEKTDLESDAAIPLPDVNGSVASQWISHSSRPHHRPIANGGRRVDTIKFTRMRLKTLNFRIRKLRRQQLTAKVDPMPVAFIEFVSQAEAQSAVQTLTHHRPMHMSPAYIGVRPFEIVWKNLSMTWWEQIIRQFSVDAAVAVLILFWALPCAGVGVISNVHFLAEKVFFLHWIEDLPSPIIGLISGLLPSLALSWIMNIVPFILRNLARAAGLPTLTLIEMYSQKCYFAFQIIQVFLITTLTSAASGAAAQIVEDPTKAESLLAKNLPTASNFYISYILVQCLGFGASHLVHASAYFRLHVLRRFTSNPRALWERWHGLRQVHWGRMFPVYTNMGVIALSYACIAPVILGFATAGICFAYIVYRYNLLFVYDSEVSTMGLSYPRALMHLLVGVYFGEVCLVGLLVLKGAYGPLALSLGLLVFTVLVHVSLYNAVGPLLNALPRTLALEAQEERNEGTARTRDTGITKPPQIPTPEPIAFDNFDFGQTNDFNFGENIPPGQSQEPATTIPPDDDFDFGQTDNFDFGLNDPPHDHGKTAKDYDDDDEDNDDDEAGINHGPGSSRALEGAPHALSTVATFVQANALKKASSYIDAKAVSHHFRFLNKWISPSRLTNPHPNFFTKWLHPEVYQDYSVLQSLIPHEQYPDPKYSSELERNIYYPPCVFEEPPLLWIPRDAGGISKQEVEHTKKVSPVTDEGVEIDEKGALKVDLEGLWLLEKESAKRLRW